MEQGLSLYDPERPPPASHTADNRVDCLVYGAYVLWHLGYPDQALKWCREALALAEGLSHHPYSVAHALDHAAWFYLLRREWQFARELVEPAITLSTEQGFPFWLVVGTIMRGSALAEQGQVEEGIVQMQQGLATFRAIGAELPRIRLLPWLAAGYAQAGQAEEGLSVLAEALEMVDKTEERWNEAELYRLKGQLTLQKFKVQGSKLRRVGNAHQPVSIAESVTVGRAHPTGEDDAESCFLKAIEVARHQQAKSLELRAVMSLAKLWQQQGKTVEGHDLLSQIYNWFTEGFDTKDLQEAKALLEELGH